MKIVTKSNAESIISRLKEWIYTVLQPLVTEINGKASTEDLDDLSTGMGFIMQAVNDNVDAIKTKVDKVEGKGLSTNDYSDHDRNKLNQSGFYCDLSQLTGQSYQSLEDALAATVDEVYDRFLTMVVSFTKTDTLEQEFWIRKCPEDNYEDLSSWERLATEGSCKRLAIPQFDVITPKGTNLCNTYTGLIPPKSTLRDRPVGLRFSSLPDPDYGWKVKVYAYNTRKGKKYVEIMSFGLDELDMPFQTTSMFRTLPSSASLMNLLSRVWSPWQPDGKEIVDIIKAESWILQLDKSSNGKAWNNFRLDRQSPPMAIYDSQMRWSASFGIRIISNDGLLSSDMKTFRVGVLSNPQCAGSNTSTYSFTMKNKM